MTSINISTHWMLLCTVACLGILWLLTKAKRSYPTHNIPPYPAKPWPIVGHFFMLMGNLRDSMKLWRQTIGDIYSLDLVGDLHILVNDYKDIKEIWTKQADIINNLKLTFVDEILNDYDKGLLAARDNNYKEQRSTSISILRSFGMGKNIMADRIQEEVSVIIEKLASLKGRPENVSVLVNVSVSNVICSIVVGKRFEHDDPYFVNLILQLNTMMKYLLWVGLLTHFKQLQYLPGDFFHVKKWSKASNEVNEMFSKAFVKSLKEKLNDSVEPDNFVASYLQEMKKMKDKGKQTNLSEDNLIPIIRTLFLAGTETTGTTIVWCILYMLHHPDVQEKVYREIEANVGISRTPNISDRHKLTYLNAVITETQRIASIAPVGLRREIGSTFEYRGYTFPKGSVLWPVLDSVHYDKKIWGDPENFRPERFINKNGELIHREEVVPFSIGRRACLGEALARMELFLFLSAMFQRFRFEPEDDTRKLPTLKESYGATVVPQPFKIRFVDRKV